ncbi:ATP-binding protein [Sphingomonas sp. TX0543]|uniref:ATP-binding protein n=1 Tax=unclassified Sphingomonas TaxID=196159 RepID=UPI0020161750|nr:ATP-binding protein [Sphingomonas sp. 3P27F8]
MLEGITPRGWLAAVIVAVTAVVTWSLSGDWQVGMVTLAGGLVALLASSQMREERQAEAAALARDTAVPGPAIEVAIDAILEPVLLVEGTRVMLANRAARTLLGEHVAGEDVRTAIRHPAAAAHLAQSRDDEALPPIDLVGLGALNQRWELRANAIGGNRRLVHLLDRTDAHAAEKMRVDFVANASHELRTPLASILGYVETLADEAGEDPEIRARFLRIVLDEARRMDRLVGDLMSLSRIEADKFRQPSDSIEFGQLIRDVADTLAAAHDGRGRDISLHVTPGLPMVTGDAVQLSQLLHNLIGNAMKYGRAGTPIRVEAAPAGRGMIRLVVADRGEGIPPEHLPRLTERFYRVDAGRSRSLGGTGLGLAIVKHIVERHRGRFDIASTVGEGTRVTVMLRAADAAVILA